MKRHIISISIYLVGVDLPFSAAPFVSALPSLRTRGHKSGRRTGSLRLLPFLCNLPILAAANARSRAWTRISSQSCRQLPPVHAGPQRTRDARPQPARSLMANTYAAVRRRDDRSEWVNPTPDDAHAPATREQQQRGKECGRQVCLGFSTPQIKLLTADASYVPVDPPLGPDARPVDAASAVRPKCWTRSQAVAEPGRTKLHRGRLGHCTAPRLLR